MSKPKKPSRRNSASPSPKPVTTDDLLKRIERLEAEKEGLRAELATAVPRARTLDQREAGLVAKEAELQRKQAEAASARAECKRLADDLKLQRDALVATANEELAPIRETRMAALDLEVDGRRTELQQQLTQLQAQVDARRQALTDLEAQLAETATRRRTQAEEALAKVIADQHTAAQAELERCLGEARADLAAARKAAAQERSDAELEAKRVRAQAEVDADSTRRAAAQDAEALRTRAERDAQAATAHRIAELDARQAALDERDTALEERTQAVEHARSELERRTRTVAHREEDIDFEAQQLKARAAALLEREATLGAASVERLESQVRDLTARLDEARTLRDQAVADRRAAEERIEALGGAEAGARLEEVQRLRERNEELRTRMAELESPEELERLRAQIERLRIDRKDLDDLRRERDELTLAQAGVDQQVRELRAETERERLGRTRAEQRATTLQEQLDEHVVDAERTERVAKELESLRNQRDWLETERERLLRQLEVRKSTRDARMQRHFGHLAHLDDDSQLDTLRQEHRIPDGNPAAPPALDKLVPRLQRIMADHREKDGDTGRRYHADDVRAFLGAMAASRMIVLKGLSGTGKTSLPLFMARAMGAACKIIPVQSGWRDRMDLLGTYNAFTEEFRPTDFTEMVYTANLPGFRERPVFVVLDECNLSRVEYYFADVLSELEQPKPQHELKVLDRSPGDAHPRFLTGGRKLVVPPNVWFVLTANEDESTFELADKTFDRSSIMQMDRQAPDKVPAGNGALAPVAFDGLRTAFDRASSSGQDPKVERWLSSLQDTLRTELELSLGNRFPQQARAFTGVFTGAGGDLGEAVDRLVATKVLRKLSRERDPGRRSNVESIREVVHQWPLGANGPTQSLALVDRVIDRLR